jgi:diaminohydroxyphosphoribosylaminopyrimidine deaminase/5-amino-6-(5-phosphoribosylamino)uracil reductase
MTDPSMFMRRALELAESALGRVSPNPAVGAVVVRDGRIVGEGATHPPGGPHAEVVALREAGGLARGATVYVSLEPCSHHGRTPPCVDALIAAGVGRVAFSFVDPDDKVAGEGRAKLAAAGVAVEEGDGAPQSMRLLEAYVKHRRTGLPLVTVKYAASLDGRIAAASGDSRWVSGHQTLAWAHGLRLRIDAIMAGVETVLVDNPRLTARPGGVEAERQPLRIVADSRGRTPADAAVLQGPAPTLIATTAASTEEWRQAMASRRAEVLVLPADAGGRVSLPDLLRELGDRGVLSLLVEGGGRLNGSFFDLGLVDKVHAVLAPLVIGAADAATAVAGRGAQRMSDALRLRGVTVERLGEDVLVTGYTGTPS